MKKSENWDPDGVGLKGQGLFGMPYTLEESDLVLLPVPWDVTVSYGSGTRKGPEAILEASPQLDLVDPWVPDAWKLKRYMLPVDRLWLDRSKYERKFVEEYLQWLELGSEPSQVQRMQECLETVNEKCGYLLDWVKTQSRDFLAEGKLVGILGGDHSSPLGLMQALGENLDGFGILQIDAHMDLREAYEGFDYSHASIMHHALEIPAVSSLVQVGIRDASPGETSRSREDARIHTFWDSDWSVASFKGRSWDSYARDIVERLPSLVYVSWDIDGLQSWLCPGTGTPVPGGLGLDQALYLVALVRQSGRRIVGFDLCEVAPSKGDLEWNANVGARVLYRLSNLVLASSLTSLG